MATPDTDRPEHENEPVGFGNREPFADNGDSDGSDDVYDLGAATDEPDQLQLVDEDASLPWLEGDDDFDNQGGSGGGQIVLLALLALSALALIIGGIWWFTRGGSENELVADGSVIEAPEQPYKEKPADPGGKTFEGTGDTSYAVSEGETRPVSLGEDAETAKPGFEDVGEPAGPVKPAVAMPKTPSAQTPAAQASAPSGPAVQVGAYSSRKSAEEAWGRLAGSYSALSGVKYRVVEGRADIGTVYRLQAMPGDGTAARSLCTKLKSSGLDCAVKD
jgi:hypothetical protein